MREFEPINKAYNSVFQVDELSIGIVVPIENYDQGLMPTMEHHLERVELIEDLGFKSLWIRDVPFNVPSFGDAGQMYDPFTYLGFLAGKTSKIALGVSSIALPVHHPVHVAKSAATIDQLSGGRLLLGVASGDRFDEYPAMGIDYDNRGELFREAFQYIRRSQESFPVLETKNFGDLKGNIDILPKAKNHKIPLLMTGFSQQSLKWNAKNANGWMYYPRDPRQQKYRIEEWRALVAESGEFDKPFMQPLYVDLQEDDNFMPQPIHLGLRTGANYLNTYLHHLKTIGVNHVSINLRFNSNRMEETLERLAEKVLPEFHTTKKEKAII
ncbi:LLM class oxidoreductase [Arenibacter algicola]|uniref:LLM class oxidoreductase n=1 Tax=Arenibacter algicola TaxID=616991 RepID=UPI001C06BC50|nr:LLM class oxidoreductase [Arenibacter algicola]MBU2905534.1 LLM class oxidoreductase [Arenibacter algicola]